MTTGEPTVSAKIIVAMAIRMVHGASARATALNA